MGAERIRNGEMGKNASARIWAFRRRGAHPSKGESSAKRGKGKGGKKGFCFLSKKGIFFFEQTIEANFV